MIVATAVAAAIVGGSLAGAAASGSTDLPHSGQLKPVFTQPAEKKVNDNEHVRAAIKPVHPPKPAHKPSPAPLPKAKKIKPVVKMPKAKPKVDKRVYHGRLINPDSVIKEALKKAGAPAHWKHGIYTIMDRESGFRPHAMNGWDSNAAQGYDMRSKGLMQTIGPTFRAYHADGTSWNIYDPVANVASAINYIQDRYGTIDNVQQANPNLPPKGY